MTPAYRFLRPLLVWAAVLVAACSSQEPTYPATGTVVYKDTGEPVTSVLTIYFESTRPPYQRSSGVVDREGKFYTTTIKDGSGSIEGEHRVRFDPGKPGTEAPIGPGALAAVMDPKYADFSTSGLVVNVQPGSQNLFRLEVERGARGPRKGQQPKPAAANPDGGGGR